MMIIIIIVIIISIIIIHQEISRDCPNKSRKASQAGASSPLKEERTHIMLADSISSQMRKHAVTYPYSM